MYGLFECTITIVDENIKERLSRSLYDERKADIGGTIASAKSDDEDDEDLIGYDSIEPGLPPASSDSKKWWLETGQAARSRIQPPTPDAILNPSRPSNPWRPTDEPDWVTVPRMKTGITEAVFSYSSTPDHPVMDRSAANNRIVAGSRRLPPPFVPTTVGKSSLAPSAVMPTQMKQRQESASSVASQSSISRKPAPPVGKKPVHLIATRTGSVVDPNNVSIDNIEKLRNTEKVRSGMTGPGAESPPPRRATSKVAKGMSGPTLPIRSIDGRSGPAQPPVPPQPRKPLAATRKLVGSSNTASAEAVPALPPRPEDLLGDDDNELQGWVALEPS